MSGEDPPLPGMDSSVEVFGSHIEDDQLFSGPKSRFEILQLERMSPARRLNRILGIYSPRKHIRSVYTLA